jgi:hypothetical protein
VYKWLRHSQRETTAIYANAVGEEQQTIAACTWTWEKAWWNSVPAFYVVLKHAILHQ